MPANLPNLTCVPGQAGPNTIYVNAFGINGYVELGSANGLGKGVSWSIENNGNAPAAAPYGVELAIGRMALVAGGGAAALVPGKNLCRCTVAGPTLAPGATAKLRFTPATCKPGLPAPLSCGLYEEKLTIDTKKQVKETTKRDNICRRYYYVPSKIKKINIVVVANPFNDPLIDVIGPNQVSIRAPLVPPNYRGTVFQVTISTVPAGESFGVDFLKHVAGAQSPDFADMIKAPLPPGPLGKFFKGPVRLDYIVTIPNPAFASAPCTSIGPPQYYEEKLDDMITCMSKEGPGCVLAQKTLRLSVLHECH